MVCKYESICPYARDGNWKDTREVPRSSEAWNSLVRKCTFVPLFFLKCVSCTAVIFSSNFDGAKNKVAADQKLKQDVSRHDLQCHWSRLSFL